jgi:hypothetical protein
MTFPVVHQNGSGRPALNEQYRTAYRALRAAIDGLQQAAPHVRDYVPDGDIANDPSYDAAVEEHEDRMRRLTSVRDELVLLGCHVQSEQA